MKKVIGLIVLAVFLASCGGGSSQSNQQPPQVTLSISPSSQQNIDQGQTVNFTASLTNDTGNQGVTWSVSGSACSGSSCGTFTNSTATSATYHAPANVSAATTVTVTATSVNTKSVTKSTTVVVAPAPSVSTTSSSMPGGTAGVAYSTTLQANGGTGSLTWTIKSGNLPPGLRLDASSGTISGTPSTPGTYTFTVQVEDSSSAPMSAQQQLTITVANGTMAITTTSLPDGTVNVSYVARIQVQYAIQPTTWSIITGSLPTGLTMDTSTGVISGIPTAAGTSTFVVQVTDSTTPTPQQKSQQLSIIIDVTGANDSVLKGHYAFVMRGCDKYLSCTAMAGSFVADGSGNITSGVEDINDIDYTPETDLTFTGTYSVGSDNRGIITITSSDSNTYSWAIAMGSVSSGVAGKGSILEFDTSGHVYTVSGEIDLQDISAFSQALNGKYVFSFSGADLYCERLSLAGAFTADGSGHITGGKFDLNDYGNVILTDSAIVNTSAYTSNDTNGRNQIQINGFSSAPANYVYYVVSASKMLVVSVDTGSALGVVTGEIDAQSGAPFSSSSLSGTVVMNVDEATNNGTRVTLGLVTFDGNGNFTYSLDDNDAGTVTSQTGTGVYNITDPTTGRFTLQPEGGSETIGYLVKANQGVLFSANVRVASGTFQQQMSGPFSNSSLNATYSYGTAPFADRPEASSQGSTPPSLSVGIATFDGSGKLTVTDDTDQLGTLLPNQTTNDTYSVGSNGRVTLGSTSAIIYIVSSNQLVMMSTDANDPNPTLWFAQR